jgi:hypothetical protein
MAGNNGFWTLVALAGFGAWIGYAALRVNADTKADINEFRLDTAALALMRNCETALSYHKKRFKQGMSSSRGCSCIANHIAAATEPENFKAAASALFLVVQTKQHSTTNDAERARQYFSTTVSGEAMYSQMPTATEAVLKCGQSGGYTLSD